jgi:hypothetical protein
MSVEQTGSKSPAWVVSVFWTATSLWVGAVVFLSAGLMPALFLNLEPSEAGRIAALVFPLYFRAGLAAGAVATAAALRLAFDGGRRWRLAAACLLAMTAAQCWTTLVVHPHMAAVRGVPGEETRFQDLHRLSVRLNGVVLVGGLLLLAGGGLLLAPRRDDA